jgi:hypothetical protein
MPEILTDAYLLFTFVFKQALNWTGTATLLPDTTICMGRFTASPLPTIQLS